CDRHGAHRWPVNLTRKELAPAPRRAISQPSPGRYRRVEPDRSAPTCWRRATNRRGFLASNRGEHVPMPRTRRGRWPIEFVLTISVLLVASEARAVFTGSRVIGWGSNSLGQADPPDSVGAAGSKVVDIAAGDFHSCAIRYPDHDVVCWGFDNKG